jgi:hypothetical protein
MYRICWHSNGSLYGGVNQNDGVGRSDTPNAPGIPSLFAVFPDEDLVRIVRGAHYGHPNPSRKQYVLMGGNPTASVDPWEVSEYPVGVPPDPKFDPAKLLFNLKTVNGTSANGCAEYTLPGPLQRRLLVCFYEGTQTIHTFAFDPTGKTVISDAPLLDEHHEAPAVCSSARRGGAPHRPGLRRRLRRLEYLRRRWRGLGPPIIGREELSMVDVRGWPTKTVR